MGCGMALARDEASLEQFFITDTAYFLFCSFFKTLIDTTVTVELKNDIQIRGTLKSVDQYLNIKLDDITVVDEIKYPHLVRPWPFRVFVCYL